MTMDSSSLVEARECPRLFGLLWRAHEWVTVGSFPVGGFHQSLAQKCEKCPAGREIVVGGVDGP